ncbi:MAG: NAD-dependent deacetylase [Crocinitomix sp.]
MNVLEKFIGIINAQKFSRTWSKIKLFKIMNDRIIKQLEHCLSKGKKISFLVGAGISAESGIPTFRGKDGYWVSGSKNYKAQEIGTYEMFVEDPEEVWKWFLFRKSITDQASPNQSHIKLKSIEDSLGNQFALISQNVDGLHRKAGNSDENTFLIHGDFDYVRCGEECSHERYAFPKSINLINRDKNLISKRDWEALKCPKCGSNLRPHVLWFDETYNEKDYKLDTVLRVSKETGILFIIGTSGATNLPQIVCRNVLAKNGMVVEINIDESYFSRLLANKTNGLALTMKSSTFLTELHTEIKQLKSKVNPID